MSKVTVYFLLLTALLLPLSAIADMTNTWEFTNAANYSIPLSDFGKIELDETPPGTAQLILQAENIYHAAVSNYLNNNQRSLVSFGTDVSLRLSGSPGSYSPSGIFTSRVLDGGVGNIWQMIHAEAGNRLFDNSALEVPGDMPGLVGLWHMNNNWQDATTNANDGTAYNGAGFTNSAKFGSHSGEFDGVNDYVDTDQGLDLLDVVTVSFWVKADKKIFECTIGVPIDISLGSGFGFCINIDGEYNRPAFGCLTNSIFFYRGDVYSEAIGTLSGSFSASTDAGVWRHIVVIYDNNATPKGHIYKDGLELEIYEQKATGPVGANDHVRFGGRADGNWGFHGLIDEVAIFNRALSEDEVVRLYNYGTTLKFRLRSDISVPLSGDFVGFDGSVNTFYYGIHEKLFSAGNFSVSNRYAQYQVEFFSDVSGDETPNLASLGLFGTRGVQFDNTVLDFKAGSFSNVVYFPTQAETPYIGISKQENGGYYSNASFESRVFDADHSVVWQTISWTVGEELENDASGIIGLYHLNGNWNDIAAAEGDNTPGTIESPSFTTVAKLGAQCAVFDDGVSLSYMTGFGFSNISAIAFWINDENPNDEILSFTGTNYVSLTNHAITISGFEGNKPAVYVNGEQASRKLLPGWNHVVLSWEQAINAAGMQVGVADGDYMGGMLDEFAVYSSELQYSVIKLRYITSRPKSAGRVKFQVRAADTTDALASAAWSVEYSDPDTATFVKPGRFFQYRAVLDGDGNVTPSFGTVTVTGDDAGSPFGVADDSMEKAYAGKFVDEKTAWYGDEVKLLKLAVTAPANLYGPLETDMSGLWHLDEDTWEIGNPVYDTSGNGRNGNAGGGAAPSREAHVGTRCGYFDGIDDYVSLAEVAELVSSNLTVSAWFKSTCTNRTAIISTYGAAVSHLTLELNGDGTTNVPGKAAFVIDDGSSGARSAVSFMSDLNNGKWHYITGVRAGNWIYLYIDGDRVGSSFLGPSYGTISSAGPDLARYGTAGMYFEGYIDEAAIWYRALSEAEIGNKFAGFYRTEGTGEYVSETLSLPSGDPAIWQTLFWITDGPYSKPLSTADVSLMALWRMEEAAGPITNAAGSNDGAISGDPTFEVAGRFGKCLDFDGAGDYVTITDAGELEPAVLTIEAWVKMNELDSRTIFDKSSGGDGYVLATDADGKPYFRVGGAGGATCYGLVALRVGKWTHIAGTYDALKVRLYVDGEVAAIADAVGGVTASIGDAIIGRNAGGTDDFNGLIDEVAIHDRALGNEEILDHYRAGAVTLKFQARASNNSSFPGVPFMGPGGSTSTYFTKSSGDEMLGDVPLGIYFQYKAYLESENYRLTPTLSGIKVFVSSYPVDNPTVEPEESQAFNFPGRLTGFRHSIITEPGDSNNTVRVEYQITGDSGASPTWYYWDNSQWTNATTFGYPAETSPQEGANGIGMNIGSFYDQFYNELGGDFRFRAFLHSEGDYQIKVDAVEISRAFGRVVVDYPDGNVDDDALITGVEYGIRWSDAGTVGNVDIFLTDTNDATISTLGTDIPNTGIYTTVVHNAQGFYKIKIQDHNYPSTIYDFSDAPFEICEDIIRLIRPDGNEDWQAGTTEDVVWIVPDPRGDIKKTSDLWFSIDGITNSANWTKLPTGTKVTNYPGWNVFPWNIPLNDERFISEKAYMAVVRQGVLNPATAGESEHDFSNDEFMMRGIAVTYPVQEWKPDYKTGIKTGNEMAIKYYCSGVGAGGVKVGLSNEVGFAWLDTNAAGNAGVNICTATITGQTENARIYIESKDYPSVNVWSAPFSIANITILAPIGGPSDVRDLWQVGTTNYVKWMSSGVSNKVNVEYIYEYIYEGVTNAGTNPIAMNVDNQNTVTNVITNSVEWVVDSPPSDCVVVRVTDVGKEDLCDVTEEFSTPGLVLLSPLGDTNVWEFPGTNRLTWLSYGVPVDISIFAYYQGGSYEFIKTADPKLGYDDVVPGEIPHPGPDTKIQIHIDGVTGAVTNTITGLSMTDESADLFPIRGVKYNAPTNGSVYTIGTTNPLEWYAAKVNDADTYADIFYAADGSTLDTRVTDVIGGNQTWKSIDYGAGYLNQKLWVLERHFKPSTGARLWITNGLYQTYSDVFTVRGIRITDPGQGEPVDIGGTYTCQWDSAALSGSAEAKALLSIEGGSFTNPGTGLPASDIDVLFGNFTWNSTPGLMPTTNAVIKMEVYFPAQDTDVKAISAPFTLRGIKIVSPAAGTNWSLGSTVKIRFITAGLGPAADATVYYSPDGAFDADDLANPVTNNHPVGAGMNEVNWTIENSYALSRMPSTNGRIRVVSGPYSATSGPFTLSGIKVTEPGSDNVLAVSDVTNLIEWVAVPTGGTYSLQFTVLSGTNPPSYYPKTEMIVSNWSGSSYWWNLTTTTIDPVAKEVVIDAWSGSVTGFSEVFEIMPWPDIKIQSPQPGDFLKINSSRTLEWIRAGEMSDRFAIRFDSLTDAMGPITLGADGDYPLSNGVYSYTWDNISAELGPSIITITNMDVGTIADTVTNVIIAPTVEFLLFDSNNVYALSEMTVEFKVLGNVTNGVDLYYSLDANRAPSSWELVNTDGPIIVTPGVGKQYQWTPPNAQVNAAWLRVQDHSYLGRTFDASKPGPFDDLGPFAIKYYQVLWLVLNKDTGEPLDRLSVSDSSGWSDSGLTCRDADGNPQYILHEYQYGTFDTMWMRKYFSDEVDFHWLCGANQIRLVEMERSEIEPDYHAMANFTFDISNRLFHTQSWLERGGAVLPQTEECIISIYDVNGTQIEGITNKTSDLNGVFWQEWDVAQTEIDQGLPVGTYISTDLFFGKVAIKFAGVEYSSGLTFILRITAAEETMQAMTALLALAQSNILMRVDSVQTNVTGIGSILTAFRGETGISISNLIGIARATTNILTTVSSDVAVLTNVVLPGIAFLTNQMVTVIGPAITGMVTTVAEIRDDTISDLARILTRPSTVAYGSTNTIQYKSRPNHTNVTISVPALGYTANMTEVVPGIGIYEHDLVTGGAGWGTNSYVVTCSDPLARDSMVVSVVSGETVAGVPAMLASLQADVTRIETGIASVSNMVAGLGGVNLTEILTGIDEIKMAQEIDLSALTGIEEKLGSVTDAASDNTFFGKLTEMLSQLDSVGASADDARKKAQTAKTEASNASGAIQSLKAEIAKGNLEGAFSILQNIRTSLTEAQRNINEIPKVVRFASLHDEMMLMAKRIEELAASEGYKNWLIPLEEAEEEELDLETLLASLEEMKGSMAFMRRLMDEMRYEPVIEETLLGVE